MERVLLAGRGELTRRLIRALRKRGIESVSVFSEVEAEQPWVEEADYASFLNGAGVDDTYLDARKIVSAAHDASATAIHPGYCFFAERPDFVHAANSANLRVIGLGREGLERIANRFVVRAVAGRLGISTIPEVFVPPGEDGLVQAMNLELPIYVKAVAGGVVLRVDSYEDVPAVVESARARARWLTGSDDVLLSVGLSHVRQFGTTVVRERDGVAYALGHSDKSVQVRFRSWMEECGAEVVDDEVAVRMSEGAKRLVEALELDGVVRVRWALDPNGGHWLLGISGRLTTGYSLTEQVFGVDLIDTQIRLALGEPLGWYGADTNPNRHGIQLRILHVDPSNGIARPPGRLEKLHIPEGVTAEVGVSEGQMCTEETEPLLASIVVTAPTRQAALVKAAAVLKDVRVEGVVNNVEVLRRLCTDPSFWKGEYDVNVVDKHLDRSDTD